MAGLAACVLHATHDYVHSELRILTQTVIFSYESATSYGIAMLGSGRLAVLLLWKPPENDFLILFS